MEEEANVDITFHVYNDKLKNLEIRRLEAEKELPKVLKIEFDWSHELTVFFNNMDAFRDFIKRMERELEKVKKGE